MDNERPPRERETISGFTVGSDVQASVRLSTDAQRAMSGPLGAATRAISESSLTAAGFPPAAAFGALFSPASGLDTGSGAGGGPATGENPQRP